MHKQASKQPKQQLNTISQNLTTSFCKLAAIKSFYARILYLSNSSLSL